MIQGALIKEKKGSWAAADTKITKATINFIQRYSMKIEVWAGQIDSL